MQTANMRIEALPIGPMQVNSVVIAALDGGDCWVIDPAEPLNELLEYLDREKLQPGLILLTHGHGDHLSGVTRLKEAYPDAKLAAPAGDAHMLGNAIANLSAMLGMPVTAPPADQLIRPDDTLQIAGADWRVLDISGHTPGGIALYCPAAGVAVCGDTLICGNLGRCDLPGGDHQRLLANIRQKLLALPDETVLIPGHGPATTVGTEKKTNPFVQ